MKIIDVHRWPAGVHFIMFTGSEEVVIAKVKERFPDQETLYRYISPTKLLKTYIVVTRGESILEESILADAISRGDK